MLPVVLSYLHVQSIEITNRSLFRLKTTIVIKGCLRFESPHETANTMGDQNTILYNPAHRIVR